MNEQSHTIREVIDEAARVLREHGIGEAERNSRLLMQHVLKLENADLISKGGETMAGEHLAIYSALLRRRLGHEPLQYITRRAEFWGLEFYVDSRVLIPRPETEHIVEAVLADYPERMRTWAIADIGCGSGCLTVALAHEFSRARLFAVDSESGPMEVTAINASRHNVANRTKLLRGDLLEPLAAVQSPRGMHIIVSNPPYIAADDLPHLQPEVSRAEPRKALVGGRTGLEIYQRLIPQLSRCLRRGGRFYLECGAGQADAVRALLEAQKELRWDRTVPDLAGIPRVVVGYRGH